LVANVFIAIINYITAQSQAKKRRELKERSETIYMLVSGA